jgi:hypothetical protein
LPWLGNGERSTNHNDVSAKLPRLPRTVANSCMTKKKVKSKKASLPVGPAVITTNIIRRQRDRMNCPRIGDAFSRTEYVDEILEDVAERILLKASTQKSDTINLSSMRINHLPDILAFAPDLRTLIDINLSRNNLFNSDHVFEVIHGFVEP